MTVKRHEDEGAEDKGRAKTRTAEKGHITTGIYMLYQRGSWGDTKQVSRTVWWRREKKTNHKKGQQTKMARLTAE